MVARHSGVHYAPPPTNRGPASMWNAGVKPDSGKYLAFLDDDDKWLPNKLGHQIPVLDAHPEVAAVFSSCIVKSERKEHVVPTKVQLLPASS